MNHFGGRLYCLNASTGAHLWNYTTGSWIWSSPALAKGRVYIGSDDTYIYCLNASTGAPLWNYTMGYRIRSSPAVAYGRVYVGTYNGSYGSYTGAFLCLDAITGAHLWNYTTNQCIFSSLAVANGCIFGGTGTGSSPGDFFCLDALTGAQLWKFTPPDKEQGHWALESSPAIACGRVYVGCTNDRLYCLNASTGALRWKYLTGLDMIWDPAVAGGRVYVTSVDKKLYCLPTELDTTPPSYSYVTESADPLAVNGTEIITISGVVDVSGIQTVLLEFEGTNHTMTNLGNGTWVYATWTLNSTGTYPYTIYIQDISGNWKAITGSIKVSKPIPAFWLPLIIVGVMISIGIFLWRRRIPPN